MEFIVKWFRDTNTYRIYRVMNLTLKKILAKKCFFQVISKYVIEIDIKLICFQEYKIQWAIKNETLP